MQVVRRTLQSWTAYHLSALWDVHHAYFQRAGLSGWLRGLIPYQATNHPLAVEAQAGAVAALLGGPGRADAPVDVLEIGGGGGLFARRFLDALDRLRDSGEIGSVQIRYVFTDYARATVEQAMADPVLAARGRAGQLVAGVFDAAHPAAPVGLDGTPLAVRPRVVLCNYLACCLPCRQLRRRGERWDELFVALDVEHDAAAPERSADAMLRDFTGDAVSEIFLGELLQRYEWREAALDQILPEPRDRAIAAGVAPELDETVFWYPYSLTALLDWMRGWLDGGGYVLINDFGTSEPESLVRSEPRQPAFYANTLNHPICFPVLDAVAQTGSWDTWRTRDPLRAVHGAVLRCGRPIDDELRDRLDELLADDLRGEECMDCTRAARLLLGAGDATTALRFYQRAIDAAPDDLELRLEFAACATSFDHPGVALDYLQPMLEDNDGADLWFEIGRALGSLRRQEESVAAYRASLARAPRPLTHANLAVALRALGRRQEAHRSLDAALALDPSHAVASELLASLRAEDAAR